MLYKGRLDVEKFLLDCGNSELVLDDIGAVHNLIQSLHDGGTADHDVVASRCLVPVSTVLTCQLARIIRVIAGRLMVKQGGVSDGLHPRR